MTMNTMKENDTLEAPVPLPLESLAPVQEVDSGKEWEKNRYWNNLLTGDPAAVPDELRRKAGAGAADAPEEERDYRLMSSINRSWVVDYKKMQKEQVRSAWPDIRLNLARELGVRDSEPEVYAALSLQHQDAPKRREVRQLYEANFVKGLEGALPDVPAEEESVPEPGNEAVRQGAAQRVHYMPLAESISRAWTMLKAEETQLMPLPEMMQYAPDLLETVDSLAELDADERARVYAVARSLDSTRSLEDKPSGLGAAMLHSVRRGVADLRYSLVQGVGHAGAALTKAAAETLDNDTLHRGAAALDKRLQVLDEVRRVAQGEIFPIDLGEESSLLEQMAVDAAGAAPGAALAFMGGAGFGVLATSGAGAAVAEARQRAPQGRQELQTAAGILGGALQAGIYVGMSRIGANMLSRTISNFAKARQAGIKGYSLAALGALGTLTAENAKLLLAGKAAHASELGIQELAARVDKVASNIDWESFGDNLADIETNMREAAMNLPFVLIAAGRAALHHFRSPSAVLENTRLLEEWGVDDATRARIAGEPDIHAQSDMLRDALRSSKRWSGPNALMDFIRSLKLLNTGGNLDFQDAKIARDFLNMEADVTSFMKPAVISRDLNNPEILQEMYKNVSGKKKVPLNAGKSAPFLQLWDEWAQHSHSVVPMNHQEIKSRSKQYIEILKDKRKGVPYYLRLNGYYHPYRGESVRVLAADRTREVVNNSYRLLMNTETLDSLVHSYASIDDARRHTEKTRRLYVTEFCRAMMRCVNGMSAEESFDKFAEGMTQFYLSRRRGARHAPLWMKRTPEDTFLAAKNLAYIKTSRPNQQDDPHLKEIYRSMVSARACGESLLELLPHSEDFQTLLSMGFKPEDAYVHLLHREFKDHVDSDIWNPAQLTRTKANLSDNMQRLASSRKYYDDYLALSGYSMESTPDGKGGKLCRIKCPDGRYSPWMKGSGYVVNTLVGNVQTSFLPMGRDMLMTYMNDSYRNDFNNKRVFERRHMFPLSMKRFIGFDHLGNTAARDLCALWLGDSTQYGVGLEFSLHDEHWKRYKGKRVNLITKEIEPESGMFLVRHGRVITPMDLIKIRFSTYWNRLLLSGWVSPEDVGQALVESNMASSSTVESIISEGRDRKADLSRLPGPERRKFLKKHKGSILPGDRAGMSRKLAQRMSELNLVYMLANLQEAPLPNTVKQWFLTTPFSEFEEPHSRTQLRHEMAMHSNRAAANEVKNLIGRVAKLREELKKGQRPALESRLRLAYEPDDSRRYEQGWCFSMGGAGAFRAAGQSFWNMLEDPVRGWKLLPEEQRQKLESELQDVCGERPVEQAMQELSEVLRQYPSLHGYGVESRGGSDVCRMVLDPIKLENPTEPVFVKSKDARYATPLLTSKGFTVEKVATLPEEWSRDTRILPAIRLLTELRRQVTDIPFADDQGVWWKKHRIGGAEGLRPRGLDATWKPETGMQTMLDVYHRLAEAGQANGEKGELNVCGVSLGGIQPGEIDTRKLKHITVYRCFEFPEHMVRLMPGEADADNPLQRAPYVLHSADGVPLLPTRMALHQDEYLLALAPLRSFNGSRMCSYDYDTNRKKRHKQVDSCLYELVHQRTKNREVWEEGAVDRINNLELFMQLFQDSRLPYFLAGRHPETLTRGEALTCELARLTLMAELGVKRQEHEDKLISFCRELRQNPDDVKLIKYVLDRVVSPDPNHYREEELTHPEGIEE